jgi:hypothetical protein
MSNQPRPLGDRKTAGYRPRVFGGYRSAVIDGKPRFLLSDVDRMLDDPQVQFCLRVLRSPLFGVEFEFGAATPEATAFGQAQLDRIWKRSISQFSRFLEYGYCAGELTFASENERVVFDRFYDVHPLDAHPLLYKGGPHHGKVAAVRVRSSSGQNSGSGQFDLEAPNAFWFAGETRYGSLFGYPRTAGMYEPWLEKCGKNGAKQARQGWYFKNAFRGGSLRHPDGMTDLGDLETGPRLMSNQDLARQILETLKNGGVLTLPNERDKVNQADYAWVFEDAKTNADVAGLRDYPKDLDREILIGGGVPPELVEASTVGSGYSGRAIPAQVFFTSMDEVIAMLLEAIDHQILKYLMRVNFGEVRYEVRAKSLAQAVQEDPAQAGKMLGGGGEQQQQPGQPQQPQQPKPKQPAQLGMHGAESLRDRVRRLAEMDYPDLESVRLSEPFDESKHPRADDGKFGSGGGETKKEPSERQKKRASEKQKAMSGAEGLHPKEAKQTARLLADEIDAQGGWDEFAEKFSDPDRFLATFGGSIEPHAPELKRFENWYYNHSPTDSEGEPVESAVRAKWKQVMGAELPDPLPPEWTGGFEDAIITESARREEDILRKIHANLFGGVELGWSGTVSRTGGIKAVGTGPDAGKPPAYGDKARSLLEGRGEKFRQENEGRTPKENLQAQKQQAEPKRQAARDTLAKAAEDPSHAAKLTPQELAEHISHLTRDELREYARKMAEKVGGKKAELAKRIAEKALGGAKKDTQAKVKPGAKLADKPSPEFSKDVMSVVDDMEGGARFGPNKVWIGRAYDEMKKRDPSLTPEQFKEKLVEANRAGHLTLSRADLAAHLDQDDVRDSLTTYANSEYHFIVDESINYGDREDGTAAAYAFGKTKKPTEYRKGGAKPAASPLVADKPPAGDNGPTEGKTMNNADGGDPPKEIASGGASNLHPGHARIPASDLEMSIETPPGTLEKTGKGTAVASLPKYGSTVWGQGGSYAPGMVVTFDGEPHLVQAASGVGKVRDSEDGGYVGNQQKITFRPLTAVEREMHDAMKSGKKVGAKPAHELTLAEYLKEPHETPKPTKVELRKVDPKKFSGAKYVAVIHFDGSFQEISNRGDENRSPDAIKAAALEKWKKQQDPTAKHRSAVASQLRRRKPVPPEVLADYADLVQKQKEGKL